jgi:type II secretory ATPase GspE/PulE/Tfp pilus assembly ATPase PilB-like protein
MINMGVEPYLIGAALNMVLAQRLVRRICARCRQTYEPPRTLRKAIERLGCPGDTFYRGVGCKACRNTGYRGRIGIHELLTVTDELRDAVVARPSINNLRQIACSTTVFARFARASPPSKKSSRRPARSANRRPPNPLSRLPFRQDRERVRVRASIPSPSGRGLG